MNKLRLMSELKMDEGLRLKPYTDTEGHTTIGYGRNLDIIGITKAEAETLFLHDTERAIDSCSKFKWFHKLNDVRQEIIANMVFNMGYTGVSKFIKMIAALENEEWEQASLEMLRSRWANQVGKRAFRLAKRMETGEFLPR